MSLKKRVHQAIEAGYKTGEIARAAKVTPSAVSQWLSGNTRSLRAESAVGLQTLTGWSAKWWATGIGPRGVGTPVDGDRGMHITAVDNPIQLTWSEVMTAETLPENFASPIPDDALSPDYPSGLELIWSTEKPPRIGSLVIVRDEHGTTHVRQFAQGNAPGQWLAAARNPAFRSFHSTEGLSILAVAKWRDMP